MLPVVHLVAQAAVLVVLLVLVLRLVDDLLHGLEPVEHRGLEVVLEVLLFGEPLEPVQILLVVQHLGHIDAVHQKVLDVVVLLQDLQELRLDFEHDLSLGVFDALDEVVVEPSERVQLLFALVVLAEPPVFDSHAAQEGQHVVVHQILEGVCHVLVQLSVGDQVREVLVGQLGAVLGAHELHCLVSQCTGLQGDGHHLLSLGVPLTFAQDAEYYGITSS